MTIKEMIKVLDRILEVLDKIYHEIKGDDENGPN